MSGSRIFPNRQFNFLGQVTVKFDTVSGYNEQNDSHIVLPFLADHQTIHYVVQLLNLTVDFCCSDAYASRVQNRIAAAMNDKPPVLGNFAIVAMHPHIVVSVEICGVKLIPVGVIPKPHRTAGEWFGADQFPFFSDDRFSFFVPYFHRHSQAKALQLSLVNRQSGISQRETGNDISSSGDG